MINNRIWRSTTIIAVNRDGRVAIAGDGQVSFGNSIMKQSAKKVRKICDGKIVAGFAGSVADAFTLFEKLESKLSEYKVNLPRAAMELAKEWRSDKLLRRLEAFLIAADTKHILVISGNGEVIEPDGQVAGIGSGGNIAQGVAAALLKHTALPAEDIARESIAIAASICVYTNDNITLEVI